jgi:tetratricopeptide (TPR) repeat protein
LTVLYHHPRTDLAVFGLANSLFAQHRYPAAAAYYSSLIKRNPAHAEAVNNLAETLAALHCYRQAITLLDDFLRPAAVQTGMPAFLTNTREEIKGRLAGEGGISADCSKTISLIGP